MTIRRPYRRQAEDTRKSALIAAALGLIATGGQKAATVRAIADKADVTPGLIRHYFASKDDLTRAAYQRLMEQMTAASIKVLETVPADPPSQLAAFVVASLRPPVVDSTAVGLWAGFLHDVQHDPEMREVHSTAYLGYRDRLQSLIAALPRPADAARLRADAIACNAVIDGLWLEASVLPERFEPGEIERIGLASVSAILGFDLTNIVVTE